MSLETHLASSEDRLLDSLTFAGKSTASYVTERRNCTFAPQSGGNFATTGIRLMRFNLADQQGWLDAGTLRLAFTLIEQLCCERADTDRGQPGEHVQEAPCDRQRLLRDREH